MRRTQTTVATLLIVVAAAGTVVAQEAIQVGGTGGMTPVMQDLARAYQARHPGERVEVLPAGLGSSGAIKAVASGKIAIGLTGRPLKAAEKGQIVQRVIGRMAAVVAVNADVPVSGLTSTQFCDIFGGKARSWKEVGGPDRKILVLTRGDVDSSTKEAFREGISCFKSLQETPDAVVLTETVDMAAALGRSSSIGLIDLGAVAENQGRFKPVSLDAVAPAPEAIRAGKYPVYRDFGVVTRGEPQGLAKRFLDFVTSKDGEQVLAQHGIVPMGVAVR